MTVQVWFLLALICRKLAIAQPTSPPYPFPSPPMSKLPSSPTIVAPSYWPHPATVAPMDATGAPLGTATESLTPTAVPASTPSYTPVSIPNSTAPVSQIPPIEMTASPASVTLPASPPNLRQSFSPAEEPPSLAPPYYQPTIWHFPSSDAPSTTPSSAPKTTKPTKKPTPAPTKKCPPKSGRNYANGKTVAKATKDTYNKHTTTDDELKVQQKHVSYYDGPLSFQVRYKINFKEDGSLESGTCTITMICFTYTNPKRANLKTTIAFTGASFQPVPITAVKSKDNDCKKDIESFSCEGGPWYPTADDSIDDIDKSKLKADFDLKGSTFDIPTCGYIYRNNSSLNNFKSSGKLEEESDRCKPP